ncbi:hypothetical protein BYT27DRAFT_6923772 [Phlegmacium glaucopus]|nr:hypothetical protein BYT27DRAFT_6923772 [Phlegmacium glaucopus]
MVLSGTEWTPEIVESWLFRNCWAMGYHNWDSLKKANLRTRILNAIELLSKWTSGVQPPEKSSISAHDAMGGGDVMGGGEFGGNNGWSYSFGAWPNQAQQPQQQPQQQAPVSSIPFPVPTPVPPPPVNVRDWASPANDHPKRKSRSPSPYSRSRHTSTGQPQEIFIPPDIDWINHGPVSFRPRSRNPTPDPADDRWNNVYPPESNSFHSTGSRVPRADPYSSESLDRSISSMLHQSHHRNANLAVPPNNTHQPVIPIALTRKQKAKQRERERERERQSKWLPRTTGRMMDNSDTSDSSDDDDEPTSPSRVWQIYAQPQQQIHHMTSSMQLHGRSSQLQPGPSGPGLLDPSQLPTQCLPHHNLTSPLPTQRLPHHNLTSPLPTQRLPHHNLTSPLPTQRLPHHNLTSPLPTQRPPHHNLTSPLPTAPPPQMPVPTTTVTHMPIGLHSPPQFFGPSQLAQYQFEQQQQVYQQEQQQRYQQQQQQQQQQQHQQHQLQLQSWSNAGVAVFR